MAIKKERDTVVRARAESISGGGGGGFGGYDEKAGQIEEENRRMLDHMDNQIDYSSSLIEEREDAIKEIESTMLEVNEIYRDLSTLVVEQGAQLDNIEANMSAAESSVENGAAQLSQASRYQKKARKKMCYVLLIVVIILGVMIAGICSSGDKCSSK